MEVIAIEKIVYYSQFLRGGGIPCHGQSGGTLGEAPGLFKRQREKEELLAGAFIMVSTGIYNLHRKHCHGLHLTG